MLLFAKFSIHETSKLIEMHPGVIIIPKSRGILALFVRIIYNCYFGTLLILFKDLFLAEEDVLLKQDRGCVHHSDQQGIDVVLEVGHLLPLALHRALQSHQHLYQVLEE